LREKNTKNFSLGEGGDGLRARVFKKENTNEKNLQGMNILNQ
jgi:hypothetical protein